MIAASLVAADPAGHPARVFLSPSGEGGVLNRTAPSSAELAQAAADAHQLRVEQLLVERFGALL